MEIENTNTQNVESENSVSDSEFDFNEGDIDNVLNNCDKVVNNLEQEITNEVLALENNNDDDDNDDNDDDNDGDDDDTYNKNNLVNPVTETEIKKSFINNIKNNYKEIILVFVLFVVLSFPTISTFLSQHITVAESNSILNIVLRGLLFALIWTVLVAIR